MPNTTNPLLIDPNDRKNLPYIKAIYQQHGHGVIKPFKNIRLTMNGAHITVALSQTLLPFQKGTVNYWYPACYIAEGSFSAAWYSDFKWRITGPTISGTSVKTPKAIKTSYNGKAGTKHRTNTLKDLEREYTSAQRLSYLGIHHHPYPFLDGTSPYVSQKMRFQQGITLKDLITGIRTNKIILSSAQKFKLTNALLATWSHHFVGNGMVNNDIKPSNILVDLTSMSVSFIDVGFADDIGGTKSTHRGTPMYMDPRRLKYKTYYSEEMSKNDPAAKVDIDSDLFSLALCIAQLWGDTSHNRINNHSTYSDIIHLNCNYPLDNLFYGIKDLDDLTKATIKSLLQKMTNSRINERLSPEQASLAWQSVEEVYLDRHCATISPWVNKPQDGLNKIHILSILMSELAWYFLKREDITVPWLMRRIGQDLWALPDDVYPLIKANNHNKPIPSLPDLQGLTIRHLRNYVAIGGKFSTDNLQSLSQEFSGIHFTADWVEEMQFVLEHTPNAAHVVRQIPQGKLHDINRTFIQQFLKPDAPKWLPHTWAKVLTLHTERMMEIVREKDQAKIKLRKLGAGDEFIQQVEREIDALAEKYKQDLYIPEHHLAWRCHQQLKALEYQWTVQYTFESVSDKCALAVIEDLVMEVSPGQFKAKPPELCFDASF